MRLRPPRPPLRRPRLLVEELDPRILYSADAAALLGLAGGPGAAEVREVSPAPVATSPPSSTAAQVQAAREIVFIDSRVPDALALADQLMQQRGTGAMFDIVVLDANADGIAQINRVLAGEHDLAAVHLISHGSEGAVQLGSSVLDAATLAREGDAVARWGEALGADGDLLLYGCNVAAGTAGQLFLHDLGALTGADVAASTGLTGSAEIGGNWTLEFATGTVHTQFTPNRFDALQWQGVLATFTVTNTSDNGAGSLRQAIQNANSNGIGLDLIDFNIGGTGIHTINLGSALSVQGAVTIDATTDDSFGANGSRPAIVLNGQGLVTDGFQLYTNSGGSTIRGFVIQNFTQDGIDIASSNGNTIVGNWIGLNSAGTGAAGNQQGVNLWNSSFNVIGGSAPADRNVISGNSGPGININTDNGTGTDNQIRGNYIGTRVDGLAAVGNGNQGIYVNAQNNTIGGTANGQGNVISGTLNWAGVSLQSEASGTLVAGNLIGLNATGNATLANNGPGIDIYSANNTIGGTTAASRNVIAGTGANSARVLITGASATGNVVIGNYIGTDITGTLDLDGTAQSGGASGVVMTNGASFNRVGTNADGSNDALERNVISGNNWYGVEMIGPTTASNLVQGNYIGTTASGLAALGNSNGGTSFWNGAHDNAVGSGLAGAGNVISGNGTGVLVGSGVTNNRVQGNLIGLGADGVTAVGNTGAGVYFYNGGSSSAVTGNVIGTNADGSNDAAERNVISANFNGVALENAEVTGNTIAGNFIGTDASGLLGRGNTVDGVRVQAGANGNSVGGSAASQRNVISGNGAQGVRIDGEASDNNTVRGNWIGVNAAGSATLGNAGNGIFIVGGADNTLVGGTGANEGNWIAGNSIVGVEVDGNATGTVIQGNRIGTDLAGTANWGHNENGILLESGASSTLVGGTTASAANIVAFSGLGGVWNAGIGISGASSINNVVLRNSIYSSAGLGIDLANDGVTVNDATDADSGPNGQLNTLVLNTATTSGSDLQLNGTYTGAANTYYRVEVFGNTSAETSGTGEGLTYLGTVNMPVGPSGTVTGSYSFAATVAAGTYISATVTRTDASYTTFYETSEFSNHLEARAPGITVTPTSGLVATEAGGTAQFSLVLDAAPTATVSVAIASGDTTEGTVSTASLSFTTANWNVAQFVTVTGVNDTLDDGDTAFTVTTAAAVSSDAAYNGLNASDVAVTTTDDDSVNTVTVDTTVDTADGDTTNLAALLANRGADGVISLREAITAANNTANGSGGADRIHFAIAGTGTHLINPASALPGLVDAVILDASTDDSFAANGNRPAIVLDGNDLNGDGLWFTGAASGSLLRGFVIRDFGRAGVYIDNVNNVTVDGNFIGGLDSSGAAAAGEGNGTDGVYLRGNSNTIGAAAPGLGNVIAGNTGDGINVFGNSNQVLGNLIGTDGSGGAAVPNGQDGITISGNDNLIGGTLAASSNLIAFNSRSGVDVWLGGSGNAFLGNRWVGNGALGIDLGADGVTVNDPADADTGSNGLQNFPVLASARTNASNLLLLTGSLNTSANSFYRIEFFANTSQDGSGYGEGQTYLGFANVATDGSGNASISTTLTANVAVGSFISATATRSEATYSIYTDTSEFAQNVQAEAPHQAPVGIDSTVTATEDTAYAFAVGDFGFSDADGDALQRVVVTTLPGQGTLRLNGVAVTAGDAVLATDITLGRLTYTPPSDANGAAFTSFTFQVQDDGGTALGGADLDASANTLTIDVAAVNDVPVNNVPATLTLAEDTPTAITGLSITDPDAGTDLLRTELTVTGGTLAAASGGGVVVTGSGTGALVLTGTLADLNAYLAGASAPTFTGAANAVGAVTLNMVSADGNHTGTGGTLAAGSFDYRFHDGTPAGSEPNNIPTTGGVTGVTSDFNSGALAIALTGSNTSFGVIYTGAIDITTAGTYTFSANADDAARVLVDGNPLVFAWFGNGSGSVALATGRHTVEIRHAQDSGGAGLSVSYAGADTGNVVTSLLAAPGVGRLVSPMASTAITLTAVNDAPVNQLPGLQVTAVNTALVLSVANGQAISVSDVDAGGASLQMTLAATHGTLTLATTSGLTFTTGDGSADATLVFTGSAAAINAALDGMGFTPTGGYNGNATITVTTNDLGNTGSGGAQADTDVLNVQVGAARFQQGVDGYAGTQDTWVGASAPASDHGAATTVVADDNSTSDAALLRFDSLFGSGVGQVPLGSTITGATLSVYVTDADAADLVALHRMLGAWTEASTYNTLTGGVQADGTEAAPGIDLTFDSGVTGWNNLSSAAITATVQAWANGATNNGWAFISNNADIWTFASSEHATVSLRPYLSIAFTPPQAPVIGTSGGAASYTENGSAVQVDSGLVLSDADSTQLTGATVRITTNHAPAQDVLGFTDQNGISGNFVGATGTLTLSGTATMAQYQAALRSVTYSSSSEAPSTLVRTLAFSASDAFVTGSSATRSLNVVAVNDAPVLGFISGNANVAENTGAVLLAPGAAVSDVDSANFDGGQVVVQFSANGQPEDQLAVRHQGNAPGQIGVAGSVVSYGGTAIGAVSGGIGGSALVVTLNASADAAAVQALTRNLTCENTSDNPSTAVRSLQGWVTDGDGGTSNIASGTITMVPSNDVPVITTTPGSLSVNENAPATAIDPALTIADIDSATIVGASVRLSVAYANGEDVLRFTDQLGVTGSWNAATGTLTLSGSASVADYQAALRSVTYSNTSDAPSPLARVISFVVNDGIADSAAATRSLTIAAVNDAPFVADRAVSFDGTDLVVVAPHPSLVMTSTLTIEATVQRTGPLTDTQIIVNKEGEYELGIAANGRLQWSFANTTPGWAWVETAYTVPADTWVHIAVTYDNGIVKTYANGTLVDSHDGVGALGDVYPLMNDLTFGGRQNAPTQRFNGLIDELRLWNVERSGAQIQAAYNAELTGGETGLVGYWRFNEGAGVTAVDGSTQGNHGVLGNGVATDAPTRSVELDHTTLEDTTLSVAGPGVLALATDPEGSALTAFLVSGPAHASAFTLNADGSFSYTPGANFSGTDSFVFSASDGSLSSSPITVVVTVTPVNDAPVITTTPGSLGYNENSPATAIDPALAVADVDSGVIVGASVRISVAYANGEDVLGFTNQLGITGSWNAGSGTLTLSGSASVADYQAALRSVTYRNTSEAPSILVRTVEFSVNDGNATSTAATRWVQVVSVDDAPSTDPASASGVEDAAAIAVTLTGSDVDGTVNRFRLIDLPANGTLFLDAGLTTPAATATDLAATAQALTLYFVPAANWNGSTSFQFVARDAVGMTDLTPATATITITAVNDAPVLIASGAPASYTENAAAATIDPGATVSDADAADFAGGTLTASLVAGGNAGDQLAVRHQGNGAGQIGVSGATLSFGGIVIGGASGGSAGAALVITFNANADAAAVQALARQLTFASSGEAVSTALRTVRMVLTDGDGGSSADADSTVLVSALNDAPTITAPATASVAEDGTLVFGAGPNALVVQDADAAGSPLSLTLTAGNGTVTLASTSGLTFTVGDGSGDTTLTVSGTQADLNAALDGLGFAPTANHAGAASLQVDVSDLGNQGSGGALTATHTVAITVTAVNDAPTGAPAVSGTATEGQVLAADTSALADADGLGAFAYAWLRDGVAIVGANASTHLLGNADVGAAIRVRVSYVDGQGSTEQLTSASVGPVVNVNDAPAGVPVIGGSAVEDQTLSVDTTAIGDDDGLGPFTFQWQRDGADVAGANASTYTLGDADVGAAMRVRVGYVDGHGTAEQLSSASVGPVANVNDAPAGVPVITGTAAEDQTLTVDTTGIGDADGLGPFTFQWQRDGVDVAGAMASSYTLADADVGAAMRVRVAYVDGQGTAEQLTSASTGPVANVDDAPTGVPVIGGSAVEDQTLTVDTTAIADADGLGPFTLQWHRNGADVAGANGVSYTLGDADVGASIGVRVSWTDGHGNPTQLGSATVGPVANVDDTPSGAPVIAGSAVEDQTLTADLSSIADADGLGPFTLQWLRNGAAVAGANGSSYTLGDADVGVLIRLQVDYLDGQGHAEQLLSASAGPVVNLNDAPSGLPSVTGSAVEDQTLFADLSAVSDADGLGPFTVQWLRDGLAIAGANGTSHTLEDADVGAQIAVRIGWLDGQGTAEQLTSAAVGPIANVDDAPLGLPAVTGTASEYQTLTADTGAITDADGLGPFTVQWLRDGVVIAGASGASLTLGAADVGHPISVRVAYVDAQGTPTLLTSAPTAAVANVADAPVGLPALLGAATEGETLGADTSALGDADGLGPFMFQWQRDGVDVAGANTSAYTLADADVGAQLTLRVSYTDGQGALEVLTSAPSAPVANVNDAPTGLPVSTGVALSGQVLVADTRAIADADGLGPISFTWLRNGVPVSGAAAPSYLISDADRGQAISVRMSYLDGHGTLETLTSLPVTVGTPAEAPPAAPPGVPPTAVPPAGPAPAGDTPSAATPADVPADPIAPAPGVAPTRLAEPEAPTPDLADIDTASSGAAALTTEVVRASAAGSTPRGDSTDYLALLAGVGNEEVDPGAWSLQDLLLVDADSGRSDFQSRPGRAAIDPNGAAGDDEAEGLSWSQIAGVSSLALTAGTVWWALRAGGLLTSLMVSMPAWRHADLLAVLPDDEDDDAWDLADDEQARRDEEAVGDMFDPTAGGAPR